MDSTLFLRQLLRAPSSCRMALMPPPPPPPRFHTRSFALLVSPAHQARFLSLPRIVQPSFWAELVPKPLKERPRQPKSKEWNPATAYIVLGLLVGSQAIQTLWLKQERGHSLRRAEAKIGILQEVIRRVQDGEDVAVESLLGTGDPEKEHEWAELINHLKNEEPLYQSRSQRRAWRQSAAKEEEEKKKEDDAATTAETKSKFERVQVESLGSAKFY